MEPYNHELDQLLTQAEALLQDEKPAEALRLLERASRLLPYNAWTMLYHGVALSQLNRPEEAITQFLAAADAAADNIDIQVDAARHLAMQDQYQDALICANRAVELDRMDAGAHAARAEALERLGRLEEAIPEREEALSLDPEDADSRFYLAQALCDLGRYTQAYTVAQPLFDAEPDDPDILRLHGVCLTYLNRHEEALQLWADIERLEGLTPSLLHYRAITLDALGRQQEALQVIDTAIAQGSDVAINLLTRAIIHEHCTDDNAAIDDYLSALAVDPRYLDAAISLVELAALHRVSADVLARVTGLLEADPISAQLLYAQGRLALDLGDYPRAQEALERCVQRGEPGMGIGWYTLAMVYGMVEQHELALSAAERALREFPQESAMHMQRGQSFAKLKRFPEAMEAFDRAAQIDPRDPEPWIHIGRLLLLDLERPADARGAFREALQLRPELDSARWMLALCNLRLGQLDEAARDVENILNADQHHLWARLVRAALHTQRGHIDDAFADLEQVTTQGYAARNLLSEPLFEPLWQDNRFRRMLHTPPSD